MTTTEIHQLFDVNYDKANVITAYPTFLPEEKDVWLNEAYNMWINQRFTGNNARQIAFEGDTKRVSDLQALIKKASLTTFTKDDFVSNSIWYKLSDIKDFRFFISSAIKINTSEVQTMLTINHTQAQQFKASNINMPWIPEPVCTVGNEKITVYYDPVKVDTVLAANLQVTYLKQPEVFDYYNSPTAMFELTDAVAYEVINLAVLLALENVESERMSSTSSIMEIKE